MSFLPVGILCGNFTNRSEHLRFNIGMLVKNGVELAVQPPRLRKMLHVRNHILAEKLEYIELQHNILHHTRLLKRMMRLEGADNRHIPAGQPEHLVLGVHAELPLDNSDQLKLVMVMPLAHYPLIPELMQNPDRL
ncbi:hypothetical protein D3C81_1465250 [compost metagenome]